MRHTCLQVTSTLLVQGNHKLYQDLLSRVESNLGLFEKLCQSTVFRVPVHAMLPQVRDAGASCIDWAYHEPVTPHPLNLDT